MDKTTQDLAWSILPKEFKEEVKELYDGCIKMMDIRPSASEIYANKLSTLEGIFGLHNLTTDAEGEGEMLYVSRKRVQKAYKECDRYFCFEGMLEDLFGSKCLPDETVSDCYQLTEPEPAEPKYHKGEKVYYNGYVYEVEGLVGKNRYALKGLNFDLHEDMIDPYDPHTEPQEENHIVENHEMVDNILKDGFSKERRLNIAAMVMQGILSNPTVMNGPELIDGDEEIAAMWSLKFADALIAEAEKGGSK